MPLVFVHGVNTRYELATDQHVKTRDGLFRQYALPDVVPDPAAATILNPYWGRYGATFAWNNASLPKEQYEPFGAGGSIFEQLLHEIAPDVQAPAQNQVVLSLARRSMERAVDLLWASGAYANSGVDASAALAESARDALEYAQHNPSPPWLAAVRTDEEFVDRLLRAVRPAAPAGAPQAFGASDLWNHLTSAVADLGNAATAFVVNPAARAVRPWLHGRVSTVIGDVFVYLTSREAADGGPIVGEVRGALQRAGAARSAGDTPLIVVAHSMGGNIAYDVLTSFAKTTDVDLLVTVGSQVGLFEELKLFRLRDESVKAPKKMPRPSNIKRWINVIDPTDPLSYAVAEIFDGTIDTTLETGVPVWSAHSSYFVRPLFHERLRARILGR